MTRSGPGPGVGRAGRLLRAVARVPREAPLTAVLVVVLLAGHAWLAVSPGAGRFLAWASTNLDNLADHPVGALAASALVVDGPVLLPDAGTIITLGLGVVGALGWIEARHGTARAATVFVVGHVGATLLTAPVVAAGIADGRYDPAVRSALDVGISYGAEAALAAVTVLLARAPRLPRGVWVPWLAFVLAWPLADAGWAGLLPDFTTVGHLLAAALGLATGALLLRRGAP